MSNGYTSNSITIHDKIRERDMILWCDIVYDHNYVLDDLPLKQKKTQA